MKRSSNVLAAQAGGRGVEGWGARMCASSSLRCGKPQCAATVAKEVHLRATLIADTSCLPLPARIRAHTPGMPYGVRVPTRPHANWSMFVFPRQMPPAGAGATGDGSVASGLANPPSDDGAAGRAGCCINSACASRRLELYTCMLILHPPFVCLCLQALPAFNSACTVRACCVGTYSNSRQAAVVASPATSMLSCTAADQAASTLEQAGRPRGKAPAGCRVMF